MTKDSEDSSKRKQQKDKTDIAFLYQALPEEQLLQITKHKTAKAIWDALKTRRAREERVQQARLQTLKSDFEMLHIKEDETIDTFTGKLTTLVKKAASLGHIMEDETLALKLLNAVPDRYLQIVASIEQHLDVSEMYLEEAIGRLKTYEKRIKYNNGKQVDDQEKLMFTRHENKINCSRGRGRGKHRFSQGRNHENFNEEKKYGETSHKNYKRNNFKKSSYDTRKLQCYKCKKIRHIEPNCPQRTNQKEQSNLVEEDLEPTLLMAILEDSNEEKHMKDVKEQKVSLHEEDVGYKKTNTDSLWYLDNGASNHMTGVREQFKELDEKVSGKGARKAVIDSGKSIDGYQVMCKMAVDGKKGRAGGGMMPSRGPNNYGPSVNRWPPALGGYADGGNYAPSSGYPTQPNMPPAGPRGPHAGMYHGGHPDYKSEEGARRAVVDSVKSIDGYHQVLCKMAVDGKKGRSGGGMTSPRGGRTSYSGYPDRPSLLPHQNQPPSGTGSGPGNVNQVPPSYSSSGYPSGTGYNSGGYASAVAAAAQEYPGQNSCRPLMNRLLPIQGGYADSRTMVHLQATQHKLTCHRLVQEVLMVGCTRAGNRIIELFSHNVQVQVYESLLDANALNGSPNFLIAVNG
uniref:Zinc finger, CCHC-type n=1 Tax=Tanacetum cinerariifolium TaxID=118510 RepID=A0A6L2NR67_TANCI|nr:zinc finger, CCHC-type [Tanacetum cinerariifolium]